MLARGSAHCLHGRALGAGDMQASMRSASLLPVAGPAPLCRHCLFRPHGRPRLQIVRRASEKEGGDDADFEARLAALKKAKGQTPYGESRKKDNPSTKAKAKTASVKKPAYDFSNEKVHWEGPPHRGDLVLNVALAPTLLWLPLTFAAVGRGAFLQYCFTDLRLSVISRAPWKKERLDAAYQEVKEVVTVGRAIGIWGDMVITLRNGDKIELRSVPRFKELKAYILERRDALAGAASSGGSAASASNGFA